MKREQKEMVAKGRKGVKSTLGTSTGNFLGWWGLYLDWGSDYIDGFVKNDSRILKPMHLVVYKFYLNINHLPQKLVLKSLIYQRALCHSQKELFRDVDLSAFTVALSFESALKNKPWVVFEFTKFYMLLIKFYFLS